MVMPPTTMPLWAFFFRSAAMPMSISATEHEVRMGALETEDAKEHVVAYFRHLSEVPARIRFEKPITKMPNFTKTSSWAHEDICESLRRRLHRLSQISSLKPAHNQKKNHQIPLVERIIKRHVPKRRKTPVVSVHNSMQKHIINSIFYGFWATWQLFNFYSLCATN